MSLGLASAERSESLPCWVRPGLAGLALASSVLALVPPLSLEAHRYEFAEALQYSMFALVAPALLTLGAPWRYLAGLGHFGRARAKRSARSDESGDRFLAHLAAMRTQHSEFFRVAAVVLVAILTMVGWRTPLAVGLLERHAWITVLEAASLLLVGVGLWLECVSSPPFFPRCPRPMSIAICAGSMWTIWVLGYLIGFSNTSWYPSFHHLPGRGLSLGVDQQLTTGVLWFFAACVFVPVIFWNLVAWLRGEENPDEELRVLVRQEHRRGPASSRQASDRRTGLHHTASRQDRSG